MKTHALHIDEYRERLKNYFIQLVPTVKENDVAELVTYFTVEKFKKKEIILRAGECSNTVYFIIKGLVRIYYVKEDKEITNWFIKENMLFAPTYSIYTGKENYANYETLEDTIVLKINYSILESFYTKYHSLEHMGRVLIQIYYATFIKKSYDVLSLSGEERYRIFEEEQSEMLNRVPLKYIATYLGVTQETLSRLRAKY